MRLLLHNGRVASFCVGELGTGAPVRSRTAAAAFQPRSRARRAEAIIVPSSIAPDRCQLDHVPVEHDDVAAWRDAPAKLDQGVLQLTPQDRQHAGYR